MTPSLLFDLDPPRPPVAIQLKEIYVYRITKRAIADAADGKSR